MIRTFMLGLAVAGGLTMVAVPAAQADVRSGPASLARVVGAPGGLVQPAHCRAFWHSHRRCVRWAGGQCRAWRSFTHRC